MCKLDLEKAEEQSNQIANIHWIIEREREFKKKIYFCFLDYPKNFVWITRNSGKFLKRWEYQTTWSVSCETCVQVKKQQLELDKELWTGSNLWMEYIKVVYYHPAYLIYIEAAFARQSVV